MGRIDNSYLYVGRAWSELQQLTAGRRVVVITDQALYSHYGEAISRYEHIVVEGGEQAKSLQSVEAIYSKLISMGADRTTMLVGVGGGIVTDITGFVAATFMRGVDFGFVPTTLLAQVDASLGGKNGVNVAGFKNMVGTFCQPKFVITDVTLLATLSGREFCAGMAEVIKAAIICDPMLFKVLEGKSIDYWRANAAALEQVVTAAAQIKLSIVSRDEREGGLRRVLNLGHTIAHAIESRTSNYYNHGEAVAFGTVMVARMAASNGLMDRLEAERIEALFSSYGFTVHFPFTTDLMEAIAKDKKRESDKLHLIIPRAIGRVEDRAVTLEELKSMFLK
jgi:3-dehydroquinate synthase